MGIGRGVPDELGGEQMIQRRTGPGTRQHIIFIIVLALFSGVTFYSLPAFAHKGHAGKQVVFLKKEEALRQMLPAGAKVSQRKEKLDADKAVKAKKEYGVRLDEGVYTYYVARDSKSGATAGAAMVAEVEYMHGEVNLAIGIDTQGNVTKAAVLGVNEKYVPDLKSSVGTGYLRQFEGVTVKKLVTMANEASNSALATETIVSRLRDMAALLTTFLSTSQ